MEEIRGDLPESQPKQEPVKELESEEKATEQATEQGAEKTEQPQNGENDGKIRYGKDGLPLLDAQVLTPKQIRINFAIRWLLINVGLLMMASSVYFFQKQNGFTLGGVGGLAIVLTKKFPIISQAIYMLIINIGLLILSLVLLGKKYTIKTAYCSLMYTFETWLFEEFIPLNGPMTEQPLLELVYAIMLLGIGGALIFNCGASSGGTDIVALILKKYAKLNVGMGSLIADIAVISFSISTFPIEITLFSILGLFVKSFMIDGVIENISLKKCVTIITTHPEVISEYILKKMQHGYTIYNAEGGFTGAPKKIILTVCRRTEVLKLKNQIKIVDPEAFVIITNTNEILGKGFGTSG